MTNNFKVVALYNTLAQDTTPTVSEMNEFYHFINKGTSTIEAQAAQMMTNSGKDAAFKLLSNAQIVDELYLGLLGKGAGVDAEGKAYWVDQLTNNSSTVNVLSVAAAIINGVDAIDSAYIETKYATQAADLAAYAGSPETPVETVGLTTYLTAGQDILTGTDGNDTFYALAGQNQNGAIANAFATGDVINGGNGTDTLEASLVSDGTVADGTTTSINGRTTNLEIAKFEVLSNEVEVEAGRMDSVKQFWSDNSDETLVINDVRLGSKLAITKDVTFGMKDVDQDAGLTAAFDTNSLIKAGASTVNSQVLIRVADVSTETNATPVANVDITIGFTLGETKYVLENVQSADGTYAGLKTAIDAALDAKGLTGLEVDFGAAYNNVTAANNLVTLPFTAQEILIKDPAGKEFSGVTFEYKAIASIKDQFLVVGNASAVDPISTSATIETNLILDNAGRGSTAGDVTIGGMSNSNKAIETLNLSVDRDSKIDDLSSGTGMVDTTVTGGTDVAFNTIIVDSLTAKGDLTIGTIGDTQTFDATNFTGENLTVTAGEAFDGSANGTITKDALYTYNTAASNDKLTVTYSNAAVDTIKSGVSINTLAGDDVVTLNQNGGSATEWTNALKLENVKVNTGAGNDKVYVGDDKSTANITAGAGNDFVQVSDSTNTGTINSAANNTAQWILNASGVSTTGFVGNGNTENKVFKAQVQVTFEGIKSGIVNVDYSNFVTTSDNINDAIIKAISEDAQLSQLLSTTKIKNYGLQVDSLIHRDLTATDFKVEFIAPAATLGTVSGTKQVATTQEMTDAWKAYYGSSTAFGSSGTTDGYTNGGTAQVMLNDMITKITSVGTPLAATTQTETGANSTAVTFNVIDAGAGDDMIVLSSSEANGFDKVVFTGDFGNDTIMNFNTGTSSVTSVADQLDFTSYLDQAANDRGASANTKTNTIDKQVKYSFATEFDGSATTAAEFTHNAVTLVNYANINTTTYATTVVTSVDKVTTDMVTKYVNATLNGTAAATAVGSTFVVRIADNASGATGGNKESVFTVKITAYDAAATNKYTFAVENKGTIEYGKMFSSFSDFAAKTSTGTSAATTAEIDAIKAATDVTNFVLANATATNVTTLTYANAETATIDLAKTITVANGVTLTAAATVINDATLTGTATIVGAGNVVITDATTQGYNDIDTTGTLTITAAAGSTIDVSANTTASSITINGGDGVDTITTGTVGATITAGKSNDIITLGAGADTVKFSVDNGSDTITGFTTSNDKLDFSALTLVGTAAVDTAATGSAIALSAAKAIIVSDSADTTFSNILTIMNAAIDTTGDVTGSSIIAIDNGTNTNIYAYAADAVANAIEIGELTLIATVNGVLAEADIIA